MNIPVFAWDVIEKRYVVFPFHKLITLQDGSKGLIVDHYPLAFLSGKDQNVLLRRFPYNFAVVADSTTWSTVYQYVPTPPKRRQKQLKEAMNRINKGKKWYSADQGQIKGYQHPRRRK